jgi:hypothetical protein
MVDGGKKRSRRAAAVHSLSAPDNYEDHALIRRQIEDFGVETTAELAKSSKERARIELLADMLADDGSEPAFFHSGLCMVSLPASKPADDHLPFERKNGKISLLINPTYISRPDGPPIPSGVPYGTRARLILLYLQTEAVRTRSPVVSMGDSLSDWMRSVGIESVSGGKRGTITQVYEQAKRIGYSTFTLTWHGEDGVDTVLPNERLVTRLQLWRGGNPDQGILWPSKIQLSEAFFNSLCARAVPVTKEAVIRLRTSSLAMDLYVWLAYKLPRQKKNTLVPWKHLHAVFGPEYGRLRSFRVKAVEALKMVQAAYPDARFVEFNDGLLIKPSSPAVPQQKTYLLR